MADKTNHPPAETSEHRNHFVREWRDYMGWSQEELAAMADVSLSKISRIENGKRGLKTDFLRELAGFFGVQPSALLEVNPSTEEGARTANMLQTWHLLTSSQQRDLLRMARSLVTPDNESA